TIANYNNTCAFAVLKRQRGKSSDAVQLGFAQIRTKGFATIARAPVAYKAIKVESVNPQVPRDLQQYTFSGDIYAFLHQCPAKGMQIMFCSGLRLQTRCLHRE